MLFFSDYCCSLLFAKDNGVATFLRTAVKYDEVGKGRKLRNTLRYASLLVFVFDTGGAVSVSTTHRPTRRRPMCQMVRRTY